MSAFQWWRSWHGAPTDPKWSVIAVRSGVKAGIVSAVAWALMDYASQHKERGSVEGFDTETYAVYSGFDETEIVAVIKAMCDKGIITDGYLANWKKRQPQREDDSYERVNKWRDAKRNVTQCNAKKSADKTRLDNNTDKEKEKKVEATPPQQLSTVQMMFLGTFGAKRLNPIQIRAITELETKYPIKDIQEYLEWAAIHGMKLGQAIGSAKTALPSWGKPKQNNNGGKQPAPEHKYREEF